MISLNTSSGPMGIRTGVTFHRRHRVARDSIVLPEGLLEGVERSALEFDRHADTLRSQGRHVRRGHQPSGSDRAGAGGTPRPGGPGRRVPAPDPASRERLLALFCEGLEVDLADRAPLVERTEGASPAFLRELVRKASLFAAVSGDAAVGASHFDEALRELEAGGRLTRSILGAGGGRRPRLPAATGFPQP